MQNKYRLNYSNETKNIIVGLTKKHRVEIDMNLGLLERIKRENPRVVIFEAAEIILEEGENGEKIATEKLKNDLNINQKDAEKLLEDIKKEIVPLAELQDSKETKESGENKTKADYDKEKYRQDLLRKISPNSIPIKEVEEILPPKVKSPEVADVEKNAEKIQHAKERITEKEEPPKQEEQKKADVYREAIS